MFRSGFTAKVFSVLAVVAVSVALGPIKIRAQTPSVSEQGQSSGTRKTLTGMVSDSMCGAQHMAKDKSPAECTRICVQQGQKYALVAGKTVYTLEGHEAELERLAAKKVTVKGTINGNTITVTSVAPIKKGAKF